MDYIQIILAALATGAMESAKRPEVARAYDELRARVLQQFGDNARAVRALEDHAEDPEVYERPLAKALTETGADQREEIRNAAERLMQLAGAQAFDVLKEIGAREAIRTGDRFTRMAQNVPELKAQAEAASHERMEQYWQAEFERRAALAERQAKQMRRERQVLIGAVLLAVLIIAVFLAITLITARG
ncbi:MAG TPA: hypothetical protein VJG32_10410 [Anaerolineae bacterium]|nr:hypothetical protein [Anaerolineae bacterium]